MRENLEIEDKNLESADVYESNDYIQGVSKYIEKDFRQFIWEPVKQGLPIPDRDWYNSFTERNAYSAEMASANKYHLSINEWRISANGALYYNAPWYSYLGFFLPMIIRMVF